jgi:hypothetical protein
LPVSRTFSLSAVVAAVVPITLLVFLVVVAVLEDIFQRPMFIWRQERQR